ncbi:MAG: Lipid A biosynthesis lauroyl acyltransferase [Syntrophorhabdus sp. PtaB.Bin047]|nr:MAG: Lipid A biosynthesis lauroyl acyltransferase [Syntrophorhabdus sp. PtaB.Bin047]
MIADIAIISLIKALQCALMALPESARQGTGRWLGRMGFALLRKRRNIAIANIRRAFPDLAPDKVRGIALSCFQKLGTNMIELILVPFLPPREVPERFSLEPKDIVERTLATGRGVIALTFHFGNWEIMGITSKLLDQPVVALARPLKKHTRLNAFLNRLRESTGLTIIVNANTAKEVMRLLRKSSIIAILADQREKRSRGVFVDFFGHKVPTSKGTAMIAMKTGCQVVPCYPVRNGFLRYTIMCGEPLVMERDGDIDDLIAKNTRKINAFLEDIIRQYPDEWFWVHQRWGRERRAKRA